MICANEECWNELTRVDIAAGFYHCSEDCFYSDKEFPTRPRGVNPGDSLFDDPFAEADEEED